MVPESAISDCQHKFLLGCRRCGRCVGVNLCALRAEVANVNGDARDARLTS